MLALKNFLGQMLIAGVELYIILLIVYCIATFFISNYYAGWYVFLREICEKPLHFCRKITRGKLVIANFDLSPLLLIFALEVVKVLIAKLFFF